MQKAGGSQGIPHLNQLKIGDSDNDVVQRQEEQEVYYIDNNIIDHDHRGQLAYLDLEKATIIQSARKYYGLAGFRLALHPRNAVYTEAILDLEIKSPQRQVYYAVGPDDTISGRPIHTVVNNNRSLTLQIGDPSLTVPISLQASLGQSTQKEYDTFTRRIRSSGRLHPNARFTFSEEVEGEGVPTSLFLWVAIELKPDALDQMYYFRATLEPTMQYSSGIRSLFRTRIDVPNGNFVLNFHSEQHPILVL